MEEALFERGFELQEQIGEGGYSKVYTVSWNKYSETLFVAKIISLYHNDSDTIKQESFTMEINALKYLSHPNVINIYDHFQINEEYILILEYCQRGSMRNYIKDYGPLNTDMFKVMAKQCLLGLEACHDVGIVHLDIKPQNILINDQMKPKLIDFGLAGLVEGDDDDCFCTSKHGSHYFFSPERFLDAPYNPKKADIWAMGVTFYFFLTNKLPWTYQSRTELIEQINYSNACFPKNVNHRVIKLIRSMIEKDPLRRPSVKQLLANSFFSNVDVKTSKIKRKIVSVKSNFTTSICLAQPNFPLYAISSRNGMISSGGSSGSIPIQEFQHLFSGRIVT